MWEASGKGNADDVIHRQTDTDIHTPTQTHCCMKTTLNNYTYVQARIIEEAEDPNKGEDFRVRKISLYSRNFIHFKRIEVIIILPLL